MEEFSRSPRHDPLSFLIIKDLFNFMDFYHSAVPQALMKIVLVGSYGRYLIDW